MSETVQLIKDRLSIVDVVSGYVKLERSGISLKARCPFHAERTPSFHVSPERGTYHCFGCGVGGDVFSFVQTIEGLDFKGALKVLAERAGVPLLYDAGGKGDDARDRLFAIMDVAAAFFESQMDIGARAYLTGRGLTDATIRLFRLGLARDGWNDLADHLRKKGFSEREIIDGGLAKKSERGTLIDKFRNRIIFPIADSAGRVVAFSGRTFGATASPDAPKYLNSPETQLFKKSKILYGFDRAKQTIRKHGFAILVEGQVDLILSHQAGFTNTVAVSGTAFTEEHATLLRRMAENLVIALDADEAGLKAAGRAARQALTSGLNVKVAALPPGSDPAELISKSGADAWRERIREAKDIITFLLDVLAAKFNARDAFRRHVEAVVLPFLKEVQSPIAREQYVQEVAQRLRVSESAVIATLGKVAGNDLKTPSGATEKKVARNDRERTAVGILLWQESLQNPAVDVVEYRTSIADALGDAVLRSLLDRTEEHEALRFGAERMLGSLSGLRNEAEALLRTIKRDRLMRELSQATEDLKEAELRDDAHAMRTLTAQCQQLTAQIARIA